MPSSDNGKRPLPIDVAQAIVSLACIAMGLLSIAMSAKQWSASSIAENARYQEILDLRDDPWLGGVREVNLVVLLLASALFASVVVLAAVGRSRYHYVACIGSGLLTITAGIAWGLLSRLA